MKKLYVYLSGLIALFAITGISMSSSANTANTTVSIVRDTVTPVTYIDLSTGDSISVWYDANNRTAYNKMNKKPVRFYVNTATGDTVYGPGQVIVNNYIIKDNDSTWRLDENRLRITNEGIWTKEGNVKLKMDQNGGKMKTEDEKIKVDDKKIKIKDSDKKKDSTGS